MKILSIILKTIVEFVRILLIEMLIAMVFFGVGCTRIVKEPVYIPTKCNVKPPNRPYPTTNTMKNLKNILIYTENLERDLNFCIDK